MPQPAGPHDVINQAAKQGVAVCRYRITKKQGAEIKRIERKEGTNAALRQLLEFLQTASSSPGGNGLIIFI